MPGGHSRVNHTNSKSFGRWWASLPDDTPVKIEVGAIGADDNATFTEEDGFCVNEVEGCEE